jgi:hypothetical protein
MKVLLAFLLIGIVGVFADCPDGTCPDGDTCCQLQDGSWGCCPYPQATCCSDHQHCCPNGYQCDLQHNQCVQKSTGRRFTASQIRSAEVLKVNCPDGSSCPNDNTCCQLESGSYGCCPYPQATCCSDHQHCCPNGYTCDLQHQQCVQQFGVRRHHFPLRQIKANKPF